MGVLDRLSSRHLSLIVLLVIVGVALYLRIALPYDEVFVDGPVRFRGADTHYFMRHIEYTALHYPDILSFDPYRIFPGGGGGPTTRPFFVLLMAGVAWLVGLGSPSVHTIHLVGAYMPPILGTLTVVTVYLLGKELFNRPVGVLSAGLLAILPGEFLGRSLLGMPDHHVVESLLSTGAILLLVVSLKRMRERNVVVGQLVRSHGWRQLTPLAYAGAGGLLLGFHLLSWRGALMAVFAVVVALVVVFVFEYIKGRRTDYLMLTGLSFFGVASVVFVPHVGGRGGELGTFRTALLIALLAPVGLFLISHLAARVSARRLAYPVALVGLAAVGGAVFYAIEPQMLRMLLSRFGALGAEGTQTTILEMRPLLLSGQGDLTLQFAWSNYTTTFFIAPVALVLLGFVVARQGDMGKLVFLVWAVATFAAALSMRRFGDYFAVSSALLTGYASFLFLQWVVGKPLSRGAPSSKTEKKRKRQARSTRGGGLPRPRKRHVPILVTGLIVFMAVFFPNIGQAKGVASGWPWFTDAWYESLLWMRGNTPEPLGEADAYYESYPDAYSYPDSAYGVLSWWDYGYWITQLAHRIPNANPGGQDRARVAEFLVAQDEAAADAVADKLGSKYVVLDRQTVSGKFYAVAEWAGKPVEELWRAYYVKTERHTGRAVQYFYPAYFECMAVRLYNFNGEEVEPGEGDTKVIRWEETVTEQGATVRLVVDSWDFGSYDEAEAFLDDQKSGNFQVVSPDPFVSPVPLEGLQHYRLVHESSQRIGGIPEVKIFEYTGSQ